MCRQEEERGSIEDRHHGRCRRCQQACQKSDCRRVSRLFEEIKESKHREETERYLREVEARGQAAELYGEGVFAPSPSRSA